VTDDVIRDMSRIQNDVAGLETLINIAQGAAATTVTARTAMA
jgi:hypothetical protein